MKIAVSACGHPRRLQQLVATVVCVYLVFNVTSPYLWDDEPSPLPPPHAHDTFPVNMVAAVSPLGGYGSNLDLKLTINVKSLVRFLDAQEDLVKADRATSDGVRPEVEILQHDPTRCDEIPEVLVYVHTHPARGDKRMMQRRTWANEGLFKKRDIRVIFVMGLAQGPVVRREVAAEFALHRDIVQGNFTDDEFSGPTKARLALTWVAAYCNKARFVLKVEDNTFVDIFWLRDIVRQHRTANLLIACPRWPDHSRLIRRDPRKCSGDVWCLRYTEFPGMTHFPPHCDAIGYLMSRAVARRMFYAMPTTSFFWLEEVYVTSLLTSGWDDVELVDLFRNYTTRPVRAYKDTVKRNIRMYVFSTVSYPPNLREIWEWTLAQLRPDEVDMLSVEVAANIPRKKVNSNDTSMLNIKQP